LTRWVNQAEVKILLWLEVRDQGNKAEGVVVDSTAKISMDKNGVGMVLVIKNRNIPM
jgi:hypothetical protein